MPLIHRVTEDMFEFAEVMDFMVNPVNLLGVSGAGLALVFRNKVPGHIEPYRAACKSGELRVGTVQVLDDLELVLDTNQNWGMINFPTKRHYQDTSDQADIKRGLMALRELLSEERYRYAAIGMPMLGCGCGMQDYEIVYPMMIEYLGDLEAKVFLSMSPSKTPMKPRYLTIAGPPTYGVTEEEQTKIEWIIDQYLERKMEMKLEDYTGVAVGGYPGVEAFVGGTDFMKDEQSTLVYRRTGKTPLVIKPNKARNGIGASLHQGNLLGEIGDDIILIKPKGHNNNRMSAMQAWILNNNDEREREGLLPRRLAVYGDVSTDVLNEDMFLPSAGDIPY